MMDLRRLTGLVSLLILLLLCFYSMTEAQKHWGSMPPLYHVIENMGAYEGKTVCVDGLLLETKSGGFALSYDPTRTFGSLPVKIEGSIPSSMSEAYVCGKIDGGVLLASTVAPHPTNILMEIFFDLMGLSIFIFFALKEWRITRKPMFIAPREDA